jgi:hypothetical protein
MNTPDPRIDEFLAALKAEGRSCPNDWHRFYLFLKSKKQMGQKDPPIPLILAAADESNATKHHRLSAQLHWAQENGCLDESVLYLKEIPVEQWNSCSKEQWDQDSYHNLHWGWTSDPKPKMTRETATKLVDHLRVHWDEVAGQDLGGVTSPLRFEGAKGRRLVVLARSDTPPPWGSWSFLPEGENKNIFTRFRAAVNAAIQPHEVDHIDFVHKSARKKP